MPYDEGRAEWCCKTAVFSPSQCATVPLSVSRPSFHSPTSLQTNIKPHLTRHFLMCATRSSARSSDGARKRFLVCFGSGGTATLGDGKVGSSVMTELVVVVSLLPESVKGRAIHTRHGDGIETPQNWKTTPTAPTTTIIGQRAQSNARVRVRKSRYFVIELLVCKHYLSTCALSVGAEKYTTKRNSRLWCG